MTFVDPAYDPGGKGYHALQSKIAIGSGELLGKGLYGGTQSQLKFLPEGHTDFVFAVFAEEWGFAGVVVLLVLFLILILLAVEIALRAKDLLGSLLAAGVVAMLCFCMVVNIGMTAGMFPIVGIPLPLVSYGGSATVTTLAALGLLLNVKRRRLALFY
jgi:rod shape determining protein RodA